MGFGDFVKKNWKYFPGFAAVGVGEALYKGSGADKLTSSVRKEYPKRVLAGQDEILGRFDEYSDDSGVRGQLSKFSQLSDMFGQEANKSYLDTTEGKSFTRQIEDVSKKRGNQLRSDKSMLGLTDEAYLAGLGKINEAEGSSMNQLVSGADNRRRLLRSQQMAALSQVLGGEQGLFGAQQNRFLGSLGASQNIYGQAQALQNQSNQALMNLFGGFADAGITAATGVPV